MPNSERPFLKVLARAVHWLFPDFAFMWLVEEAKKNMPLELDFLNEGRNAEKVAKMLAHFSFLKVGMSAPHLTHTSVGFHAPWTPWVLPGCPSGCPLVVPWFMAVIRFLNTSHVIQVPPQSEFSFLLSDAICHVNNTTAF